MDTARVVARFEAERQALAVMDHPAIAKVFDAGATPQAARTSSWSTSRARPSRVLQPKSADHPRSSRAVLAGLRRRASRASERHHPSRPEALERSGDVAGWPARPQDHRLRLGESHGTAADRPDAVHRTRHGRRHARVHEPRAGRDDGARHRHTHRRVCLGRHPLRAVDRSAAVRCQAVARAGSRRSPAKHPRGRPASSQLAADDDDVDRVAHRARVRCLWSRCELRGDLDWITMRALEKDRVRRYGSAAELALEFADTWTISPSSPVRRARFTGCESFAGDTASV